MAERFFQELLQCQELDQSGCYSYDNCLKKVEIYINIDNRHESTNYKNHVLLIDFITASNKPFGLWNTKLNYKQNDKRKRGRQEGGEKKLGICATGNMKKQVKKDVEKEEREDEEEAEEKKRRDMREGIGQRVILYLAFVVNFLNIMFLYLLFTWFQKENKNHWLVLRSFQMCIDSSTATVNNKENQ